MADIHWRIMTATYLYFDIWILNVQLDLNRHCKIFNIKFLTNLVWLAWSLQTSFLASFWLQQIKYVTIKKDSIGLNIATKRVPIGTLGILVLIRVSGETYIISQKLQHSASQIWQTSWKTIMKCKRKPFCLKKHLKSLQEEDECKLHWTIYFQGESDW